MESVTERDKGREWERERKNKLFVCRLSTNTIACNKYNFPCFNENTKTDIYMNVGEGGWIGVVNFLTYF